MHAYDLAAGLKLYHADCREVLRSLPDHSIDSIVTDPPYALVFMGKQWDTGDTAHSIEFWQECLRVLKPGGHVVAFAGTRTYHRLAVAIEDAGFEIRDMVQWIYGSGFPKSHDVSKGIDRAAGAERQITRERDETAKTWPGNTNFSSSSSSSSRERKDIPATESARQWQGWGTALKPANEPICLARKPLSEGTVAANVLKWGTGAINVDRCRVTTEDNTERPSGYINYAGGKERLEGMSGGHALGRWPANVLHDGSEEVVRGFPESSVTGKRTGKSKAAVVEGTNWLSNNHKSIEHTDSGSAARFFYSAKASKADRAGSKHPTIKPIKLMQYLARLITPPGGTLLDPFAGSGTTGVAAHREGFNAILCEREDEYVQDIMARFAAKPEPATVRQVELVAQEAFGF